MEEEKRNVPKQLKFILEKDVALTKYFINSTKDLTLFKSMKIHQQMFEISCHGIVWLTLSIGSIWIFGEPSLFQLQINLFFALILDIIAVALLKAFTRRRRPAPAHSTDFGPDKFSFPSGHASRAALIAFIFLFIHPLPIIFFPPMIAWVTAVCFSRIIAERHHILDVLCGIGLGLFEGLVFYVLWLSKDASNYLVSYISDEKFFGGEYHV